MKIRLLAVATLLLFSSPLSAAGQKIKIVATTTTFASMAKEIAGDRAEVYAIANPRQNIHFYQPTPRDVLKVKKADVLIHGGFDLELWRDPLLVAAGNKKFLGRAEALIDASQGIEPLEVPTDLSRAEGDIHRFGNPHFWVDPENAKQSVRNIAGALANLFPDSAEEFLKNAEDLSKRIDQKLREWETRLRPWQGTAVITYHKNWSYFAKRFGLEVVAQLEPKPGIPPTPRHLENLEGIMKEKNVKLVIKEVFHEGRSPKKLAEKTGATVLTLAQSVGETKEGKDYISMMENNIRLIEEALR